MSEYAEKHKAAYRANKWAAVIKYARLELEHKPKDIKALKGLAGLHKVYEVVW